jgi:aryl-alcohol dehydrogenase-like predicted oxidoreductase
MGKETDLALFGDDEKQPKRHILDTVNDRLRVNNSEEDEATVQGIAKKLNMDTRDLYQWADDDPILKEQLEQFKTAMDTGLYSEHGLGNRADSHDLAEILLRAKKRHGK